MKRKDYERIEELVALYLSYVDKNDTHERIAKEGESLAGKIETFRGDLPQSGAYKPETIGRRVDAYRKIPITRDEERAHGLIMEMRPIYRYTITVWPQIKNKIKPGTRDRFRKADLYLAISDKLGRRFTETEYEELRAKACEYLIKRDAYKTPHIDAKKIYATAC